MGPLPSGRGLASGACPSSRTAPVARRRLSWPVCTLPSMYRKQDAQRRVHLLDQHTRRASGIVHAPRLSTRFPICAVLPSSAQNRHRGQDAQVPALFARRARHGRVARSDPHKECDIRVKTCSFYLHCPISSSSYPEPGACINHCSSVRAPSTPAQAPRRRVALRSHVTDPGATVLTVVGIQHPAFVLASRPFVRTV